MMGYKDFKKKIFYSFFFSGKLLVKSKNRTKPTQVNK